MWESLGQRDRECDRPVLSVSVGNQNGYSFNAETVEAMTEVDFEVDINRRTHFVAVDEEIAVPLSEILKHEHIPSGAIINSWLREKISDYSLKH